MSKLEKIVGGVVLGLGAMGAGMTAGYVVGNIMEYIPFIRNAMPWLAEYSGFQVNGNTNEDSLQLVGALCGGYWMMDALIGKDKSED
ncbi:MAG: hypothetical protein AABW89_03995 [Nanoarchaeota archaeon]